MTSCSGFFEALGSSSFSFSLKKEVEGFVLGHLVVLTLVFRVLGIKPGPPLCKANTLTTVISHESGTYFCLWSLVYDHIDPRPYRSVKTSSLDNCSFQQL